MHSQARTHLHTCTYTHTHIRTNVHTCTRTHVLAADVSVAYGPPGSTHIYPCPLVSATRTQISCNSSAGLGSGLRFNIKFDHYGGERLWSCMLGASSLCVSPPLLSWVFRPLRSSCFCLSYSNWCSAYLGREARYWSLTRRPSLYLAAFAPLQGLR